MKQRFLSNVESQPIFPQILSLLNRGTMKRAFYAKQENQTPTFQCFVRIASQTYFQIIFFPILGKYCQSDNFITSILQESSEIIDILKLED